MSSLMIIKNTKKRWNKNEWINGIYEAKNRYISKALTLVESENPSDKNNARELLSKVWGKVRYERVKRIGFTGTPGAGKSTLIGDIGENIISSGEKLAVLCVDPSSPVSGGAILGDRVRMSKILESENVFVRGVSSKGDSGGISRGVGDASLIFEAAGCNSIIIESGGVGQSQVSIRGLVDCLVVVIPPAGGDDLQAMKRGVLELADIIVVSKNDGEFKNSVKSTISDIKSMLQMRSKEVKVVPSSVVEEDGTDELSDELNKFFCNDQRWEKIIEIRQQQRIDWMNDEFKREFLDLIMEYSRKDKKRREVESMVRQGEIYPGQGAFELLKSLKRLL